MFKVTEEEQVGIELTTLAWAGSLRPQALHQPSPNLIEPCTIITYFLLQLVIIIPDGDIFPKQPWHEVVEVTHLFLTIQ